MLARWGLLLFLFLVPMQSLAAIAVVQSKGDCTAGGFTSTSCAMPGNSTAGNVIAACGSIWNGNNLTDMAITDSVSTPYTEIIGAAAAGTPNKTWMAYGVVPSTGANTLTSTPAGGTGWYMSWGIVELSGVDTGTPLDADGSYSTGSSTSPSDGITTVAADAIVLACLAHGNSGSTAITPDTGGGWTAIGEIEATGNAPYAFEYQIFSSAGSKTAGYTLGTSTGWVLQTISLDQAAAGANVSQFYRRRPQ